MTGRVDVKVPTAIADVPSLLSSHVVGAIPGRLSENCEIGRSPEVVVVVGGTVVVVVVVVVAGGGPEGAEVNPQFSDTKV
jgi:hypothetical protein